MTKRALILLLFAWWVMAAPVVADFEAGMGAYSNWGCYTTKGWELRRTNRKRRSGIKWRPTKGSLKRSSA